MNDLLTIEQELKTFLIKTLALEDISEDDIGSDLALFGDGLGLDSVDALELGVAIHKTYGVKISAKSQDTYSHFANIHNLARFISSTREDG